MSEEKLPKGWKMSELFEIAEVQTGKKDANYATEDGEYFFFTCAMQPLKAPNYSFEGEVLLLPGNGANVGQVIYFKGKFEAYQRTYIVCNIKIEPKFLYYYFLAFWKEVGASTQYGSATNYIKIGNFKDFKILNPSLPEQQHIVAKLDALFGHLDSLREKLDQIPGLLKNFRQQVLTQAVTGELTKEWREGKGLGEWEETTFGNLFEVKTGGTPRRGVKEYYEGGTIPWVKSGLVKNEMIFEADEFITELAIKESNVKIFPIDTILVAMYGEGKTRGQVGWLKIEASTNQAIAALVNETMPSITRSYVFYYCLSQYNDIRAKAEGGNQPNLNLSKVKNWEISIPTIKEQNEIVSRIDRLFKFSDKIESQYQSFKAKIDQLPQAILAKAFRGELVEEEVKEYRVEEGARLMAADAGEGFSKK